ncbi:MAG TPA: hypothetical protein PKL57_12570 [Candidatus Wallbacteria bacterium]|nr:hypothetical protein [Candidatus Wallbacteria bacterium]
MKISVKKIFKRASIEKVLLIFLALVLTVFAVPAAAAENAAAPEKAPAASQETAKPEAAPKDVKRQVTGVVESVSAPVNPHETIMVVDCGDSTSIELILSPRTRFYPYDYYPCPGDKVKVNYAVLGIFKKYVIAYGVSLVEEFSGINRETYKIEKK